MTEQQQTETLEHKKGNPPKFKNALDRISRKQRRNDTRTKYNNNRKPKNSGFIDMGIQRNTAVIFIPKKKKLKGWQKKS